MFDEIRASSTSRSAVSERKRTDAPSRLASAAACILFGFTDKKEAVLTLVVKLGTSVGEYTLSVSGQTQVPYSKDAQAKQKPNTLVSQASPPLTLIVKP